MTDADAIKIHVLHCGAAWVDEALLYQKPRWNPIAFTGIFRSKKHRVKLPLTCYLIEIGNKKILVDTGWNPLVRSNPVKALGIMQSMLSKVELLEGKAISEQLQRLGLQASDIDILILTHLHGDHISGLQSMSSAKQILVSGIELRAAKSNPIVYNAPMWKGIDLKTFRFNNSNIGPENLSYDLLGDGSIQLVAVPGHAAGQTALLIQNKDAFIILCADAAYNAKSWNESLLPGITTNKKKAKCALEWLATMSKKDNCKGIFASHDASVAEQIITL